MGLTYFSILIFLISVFNAFSMRFQEATLYWGKKLVPNSELLPHGMQNSITPSFQNFRNIFLTISIIGIMVLGFIFLEWYIALISGPITFILGGFLSKLLPKPESKYYHSKIHKVLNKKKNNFIKKNDSMKLYAVENVIKMFNDILPKP